MTLKHAQCIRMGIRYRIMDMRRTIVMCVRGVCVCAGEAVLVPVWNGGREDHRCELSAGLRQS